MAAITTKQFTTSVTEKIPTEVIDTFTREFNYWPLTFESIAWASPGKGSIAKKFGYWEQLDGGSGVPAGTKTETDVFTDVDLTIAEGSATPGMVGFMLKVSYEAIQGWVDGETDLLSQDMTECLNALRDRMDSDGLALANSLTSSAGAVTDNFTIAKFRAAAAAYRALKLRGPQGHACVMHYDGLRDLEESLGATGGIFAASTASQAMFGPESGYKTQFYGFSLFETGNLPADSTGHDSCMVPVGARSSPFGIVITRLPEIRFSEGDDAVARATVFMRCMAWYGVGCTHAGYGLKIKHRS